MKTQRTREFEDLCRAFAKGAYPIHTWDGLPGQMQEMYRDGIASVLETHVRPLLAGAWLRCVTKREGRVDTLDQLEAEDYAASVIATLSGRARG